MAFPDTTYTDNESAAAGLTNKAAAAGLSVSGLNAIAQLQSVVANLLVSDPSSVTVPAGDILSGTFGANKAGGADTGTYAFPGAVTTVTTINGQTITSAAAFTGTASFAGVVTLSAASVNLSTAGVAFAIAGTTTALTANAASGALTVKGNVGTGTGAVGGMIFQVPVTHGSDSVAQTLTTVLTLSATTVVSATFAGALAITGALTGATTIAASTSVTVTSASAVALTVGLNGATNPAFAVDSSTALQVAGLKVTGAVTTGTVAIAVTDTGAGANLTLDAQGTGTIGIGSVSTGRVTITPVTTITGLLTLTAGVTGTLTMATAVSLLKPGATSFNVTNNAGTANNLTIVDAGGITLGNPAAGSTQQLVVAGTGYGAGVASMRFNGLTTAAVANQTGTITNAPTVGNPTFWMPISIAGSIRYVPCWS